MIELFKAQRLRYYTGSPTFVTRHFSPAFYHQNNFSLYNLSPDHLSPAQFISRTVFPGDKLSRNKLSGKQIVRVTNGQVTKCGLKVAGDKLSGDK